MKTFSRFMLMIGITITSLTFYSCSDDDGYSLGKFWIDIATVKTTESNSHYFRLDDGSTLWPAAGYYTGHNLQEGERAIVNYTILSDSLSGFSHYVKVNWVDPVLTKKPAENLGNKNDSVYGTDPVRIESIWLGDGYLNILFQTNTSGSIKHFINLVKNSDGEIPYTLEFRHNAYDDYPMKSASGIVCFDLSELPDTENETVKLTIRVQTFDGEKEYVLDYKTNQTSKLKVIPSNIQSGYFERTE